MEQNNSENKRGVTVKTAAELLGVSVRTVWRMISDGQLCVVRIRERIKEVGRWMGIV